MLKIFRYIRMIATILVILLIAFLFIFHKYIIWGIVSIIVALLIFWCWQLFSKNQTNKFENLERQNTKLIEDKFILEKQIEELKTRKFNISSINAILDLGLIEIDTSFTRIINQEMEIQGRSVHFWGALKVDVVAKYGIDLKNVRIRKGNKEAEYILANVNPTFLSFKRRHCEWKISEILEYKQIVPVIGNHYWIVSPELERVASNIKENCRIETEKSIENGPEEMKWLLPPLKKQIEKSIEVIFNSMNCSVSIVDKFDNSFVALDQFAELTLLPNNQ